MDVPLPFDAESLARLLAQGLSVEDVAVAVGRSPTTVRRRLRELGLVTVTASARTGRAASRERSVRTCPRHGEVVHIARGDGGWRCGACRSAAVAARRRKVKATLVEEAGGACVLCGYDRSVAALQFHHVDRTQKRFSVAAQGVTRSLDRAREEVRKCVLLCANCHAEVETGVAKLPATAADDEVASSPG